MRALAGRSVRFTAELEKRLKETYPVFAGIVARSEAEFGETWVEDIASNLGTLFGPRDDPRWKEALKGYALLSLDTLRSQHYLEQNGRYEATDYDFIRSRYWENRDFMLASYLPGIFVSHFLWPQHYRLLGFYRGEVVPRVSRWGLKRFAEVGTGPGLYSKETLVRIPGCTGIGYDISEHSLAFTSRVMHAFGVGDRYQVERREVSANPAEAVDLVICQEVLEHLEEPFPFLVALRKMVRPGGIAYITAAITAAQSDHIYLFRDPAEARQLVEQAGFSIMLERTEATDAANVRELVPRISAFLCTVDR
jgi:2-polyprenyl-3-methyl-5-hydroxy-6-metoxy-1,4-benzoquinol methylase